MTSRKKATRGTFPDFFGQIRSKFKDFIAFTGIFLLWYRMHSPFAGNRDLQLQHEPIPIGIGSCKI